MPSFFYCSVFALAATYYYPQRNHDCRPNFVPFFRGAKRVQKQPKIQSHAYASSAYYRFDDKTWKTLMLQVFVLRDIKTVKEILFNCVPPSRY